MPEKSHEAHFSFCYKFQNPALSFISSPKIFAYLNTLLDSIFIVKHCQFSLPILVHYRKSFGFCLCLNIDCLGFGRKPRLNHNLIFWLSINYLSICQSKSILIRCRRSKAKWPPIKTNQNREVRKISEL